MEYADDFYTTDTDTYHLSSASLGNRSPISSKIKSQCLSQTLSRDASKHSKRHYSTTLKDSNLLSKEKQTMHYLTPISYNSPRSPIEGEPFIDYMRLFIEPFSTVSLAELSISSSSYLSCYEPELQRTIVMVKPDAMTYQDVILRKIFESGFQVMSKRTVHLTPEQVSEIYAKYYGSPSFPHLVVSVSAGPILVVSIAAKNVISRWKSIIGPDGSLKDEWFFPISMRKRFGLHPTIAQTIHGSENIKESNRENRYFYPENILEPLITDETKVNDFCGLYINSTLISGLVEVVKTKPLDPILYLADWLLLNNPYQPRLPYKIALTAT